MLNFLSESFECKSSNYFFTLMIIVNYFAWELYKISFLIHNL